MNVFELPDLVLPYWPLIELVLKGAGAVLAVVVGVLLWRAARKRPLPDVLTIVAASIATGVSAQGMWRFSGDVLGLDGPLRLLLFAFVEIAIITSAVRARRNMRENFSAGIDGIAVWALTVLTAILSSMDARSLPEAMFRLAAPLVAAWLWERGMAIERHRIRGTGRINWRLTPERVLVRLGLAEATDRTAGEVDAHRRLTRVALAAKRAKTLREAGAPARKMRRAFSTLDKRIDQAVALTGLARDPKMQWALLDQVTALRGGASLMELPDVAPWAQLDHPAITGAAKHHEAVQLAHAMREWTDALNKQRDPEVSSAIHSMAAYIAGFHGLDRLHDETRSEPLFPVDDQVADEVSERDIDDLIDKLRGDHPEGEDETDDETADETRKGTEAMRLYWQRIVEGERRIPTGVELATAGGCTPQYGARMRGKWLEAMDGRTRRALQPGKRSGS